jgi:hypothetical protein
VNRYVFWCLVALFCSVVFFGVGTAASLGGTIADTTGKVGGVVVGSAPKLVNGFRDGIAAGGNGNDNSVFKTFDQAPEKQQQPRNARAERGGINASRDGR